MPVTMEFLNTFKFLFSLSLFFLNHITTSLSYVEQRETYIIHMDNSIMSSTFASHHDWYTSTLSSLDGTAPTHLYTYNHVMNGFGAVLSQSQLQQLEKMPGHFATYPVTYGELHTTHTPKFLGLKKHAGVWPAGGFGDDMIIGMLDTGIWPESESFNDRGMPPVPTRWRGMCENGEEFDSSYCNKKLIGARSFSQGLKQRGINISTLGDYDSPRDFYGHGSHTSSTAGGSRVEGVDYFGYAKGTTIGVAPLSRLAMYKVLFNIHNYGADSSDTLAGMDQAIEDGVDLMSISIGFTETTFDENPIAVGSFAAMEKGIFVTCSAGNSGPEGYTVHNAAPWITTVGAGTIDRDYIAYVTLGNGSLTIKGKSAYPEDLLVSRVPIYYGHGNTSKQICDALDPKDVSGKIVFCSFSDVHSIYKQLNEVYRTSGVGAIVATDLVEHLRPDDFFMPFVAINLAQGRIVEKYLNDSVTVPPTVDIKFQITELGTKPAPQVADFSSRGPSRRFSWILKPDILAPGVDILAAWVPNKGVAPIGNDYLFSDYAFLSGTSMSTPHVAGIAALLKSAHRDWSSAMIRSAMMTTAYVTDNRNGGITDMNTGLAGTPLDFGGGHVDPNKALDPGLVYDIQVEDYINYLCGLNYTSQQIGVITKRANYNCNQANLDLNYPSFIVILTNFTTTSSFKRVLTNVADSPSVYRASVKAPLGMKVVVEPMTLTFGGKFSRAEYSMSVEIDVRGFRTETNFLENYGYLIWYEVNGKHVVKSPIVSAFAHRKWHAKK